MKVFLALVVLAGIVAALVLLPVRETVVHTAEWVRASGAVGIVVFALLYVVAAVFMLPGSMMSVAGGFAWGTLAGTALTTLMASFAGIIPFLLGRYVARDWVRKRAEKYPRLKAIDAAVGEQGFKVVLLLRLSLAPYNFLNYALGLTRVNLRDFFFATWLGLIPAVAVLSWIGSLITEAAKLGEGLGPQVRVLYVLGFVTTTVGAVLLTRMARRALANVLAASGPEQTPEQPERGGVADR